MKIFLLGATGETGFEVLKALVRDNYQIKALLRTPSKLNLDSFVPKNANPVEVVKGSVMDAQLLEKEIKGCEVVISALGTGTKNNYTEIYSQGGRNILKAMRTNSVKRLITITSGLIDHSDPSTDNFFLNRIIRPNFNKVYSDQTKWETILDDTNDIDWTCVRPTYLVNKQFTGKYRVQDRHCPPKGTKISRPDLADFMVKQIDSKAFIRKKPVIAY